MKLSYFIGGREVEAKTPFVSVNPSNTNEVVASFPAGGKVEPTPLLQQPTRHSPRSRGLPQS